MNIKMLNIEFCSYSRGKNMSISHACASALLLHENAPHFTYPPKATTTTTLND